MIATSQTLQPMVDKLMLWKGLNKDDRTALLSLPHTTRTVRANEYMVRESDEPALSCVLLSGLAFRHKLTAEGGRQIFSIHMKGDVVDLHNSLLGYADHNLQALTEIEAAFIPMEAVKKIASDRAEVGKALWCETLVDGSIFREWMLNIGRRDATTRMAHMLCEFALRLQIVGLGEKSNYVLPMTQDQLADVLALTPVHVNRVLKTLGDQGYITRTNRTVAINDWLRLAKIGDFDARYLHLDRVGIEY